MKKIKLSSLRAFTISSLVNAGVTPEHAAEAADVLIMTDTFGVMTHGTKNLYQYIQKMQAGGLDPHAEPTVEREGAAWAIINGNKALGMVSGCKAMKLAIKKAKETGIAYVGVHNSCHFGAAGCYANLAASEGLIGLSMSNADPVIAVPGGRSKAIGTNPFSFAAPLGDGTSLFLDIALSNVAALKVISAKEKGQPIPDTWLVDENGLPTTDADKFPKEASLQPMAAHKGYGLAVLVELLSSVVTGAGMLSEVASWNLDMSSTNNVGHAFIAIDISQMLPYEQFTARMQKLADELHQSPKAVGCDRIWLPGEMEWEKRKKALASGELELTDAMVNSLTGLSEKNGMELNLINE